jgi:hypothetical protein
MNVSHKIHLFTYYVNRFKGGDKGRFFVSSQETDVARGPGNGFSPPPRSQRRKRQRKRPIFPFPLPPFIYGKMKSNLQ